MSTSEDRSYRNLLRTPTFGRVLVSMELGRTSQAMLPVALVLLALTNFSSSTLAGALTFLSIFPGIVASPFVGALIDRFGSLPAIRLDYVIGAVLTAAIAVLPSDTPDIVPLLLGLTFVLGLSQLFSDAGFRSLFPGLVPDHLWERVNAIDSSGYQIASIAGPPIAAALFGIGGPSAAFLAIAIAYAASALCTIGVRAPDIKPAESRPLFRTALEGLSYVWNNTTLRGMAISVSLTGICLGIITIVVPVLIVDTLGGDVALVGVAFGLAGVVGIAAAITVGRLDSREREKWLIVCAHVAITVAALMLLPVAQAGLVAGLAVIMASMGVRGAGEAVWDLGVFTLRQRKTDKNMMGRAFAISMALNFSGFPIGAALGGMLAAIDIGLALWVAIAFGLIGTALGQLLLPAPGKQPETMAA